MKLLTRKDRLYNANALHTDLNILKVKDIHETAILQFVYCCIKETPIDPFVEYFKLRGDEHYHDLRNNDNISTRTIHVKMGKGTTHYTGATLWNKLPNEMTEIDQANMFKEEHLAFYQSKYVWLIYNTDRDNTWPNRPIWRCVIWKKIVVRINFCGHHMVNSNSLKQSEFVKSIFPGIQCLLRLKVAEDDIAFKLAILKQGKSEGFDSCDRPSNLTQIGFKSSIFQSGNA